MTIQRLFVVLVALTSVIAMRPSVSAAPDATPPAFPEGYRTWQHVKSGLIGPAHKRFASVGGFQHVYANRQALQGYRTREFPEGSVIVFEWLEMTENEGAYVEGAVRNVDLMVKDAQRYASTGGWGFQRFVKNTSELAATPTPQECFECHQKLAKDGLVLSHYRQ